MIAALQKQYARFFLKPYLLWYLKKPRTYFHNQLRLKIYPGVFHPAYFFSTLFFAEFLKSLTLENKTFCEVGAGSGLISFLAVQRGARVVAIELNETAVKGINENMDRNNIPKEKLFVHRSDLFDSVECQKFDLVFINPPYFFKSVTNEDSLAWNCGINGEYFEKLFFQLGFFLNKDSGVYMTLAENCDIPQIRAIAYSYGYELDCVLEKKIKWEKNFIFKLKHR